MAKKLFRSELAGRAALLILSFYLNHIAYCSLVGSEIIFVFLLLLGVLLLISSGRKAWLVPVSGIVFGLACVVKPQTVLVPMVVAGSGARQ
jgi:4-amino-4-deoxy-L-arabinose transferase-like glycosyltransferase